LQKSGLAITRHAGCFTIWPSLRNQVSQRLKTGVVSEKWDGKFTDAQKVKKTEWENPGLDSHVDLKCVLDTGTVGSG
jgi:hypothetical protein